MKNYFSTLNTEKYNASTSHFEFLLQEEQFISLSADCTLNLKLSEQTFALSHST